MADQRQFRKTDYEEIPGQIVVMTGTPSYNLSGDGTVTVPGVQGFVPPPITFQRAIPTYNDGSGPRQVANLDGIVQPGEYQQRGRDSPVAGPSSAPDYESKISSNPFDDFIIEGYENVTYEPSMLINISLNRLSNHFKEKWRILYMI